MVQGTGSTGRQGQEGLIRSVLSVWILTVWIGMIGMNDWLSCAALKAHKESVTNTSLERLQTKASSATLDSHRQPDYFRLPKRYEAT